MQKYMTTSQLTKTKIYLKPYTPINWDSSQGCISDSINLIHILKSKIKIMQAYQSMQKKIFDMFQHSFMTNILNKIVRERTFIKIMTINCKPATSIIFIDKNLFIIFNNDGKIPFGIRDKIRISTVSTSIKYSIRIPSSRNQARKINQQDLIQKRSSQIKNN